MDEDTSNTVSEFESEDSTSASVATSAAASAATVSVSASTRLFFLNNEERERCYRCFLSHLHEANELSIGFYQHEPPYPRVWPSTPVFRLGSRAVTDAVTVASDCVCHEEGENFVRLERTAIQSPDSRGPDHTFTVDPCMTTLIMRDFLPSLSTLSHNLRELTLHGLDRVAPSFYPELISILANRAPNLTSLVIRNWNAFISSPLPHDDSSLLFSRLHRFHLTYSFDNTLPTDPALLGSALSCMSLLQDLACDIQAKDSAPESFWEHAARGIAQLHELRKLKWVSTTTTTGRALSRSPHEVALYAAIGTRPLLQSLELSWELGHVQEHRVLTRHLSATPAAHLHHLTLYHVPQHGQAFLGKFLESPGISLRNLRISFGYNLNARGSPSTFVSILEGVLRNTTVTSLDLGNVAHLDNDAAKMLQMVCLYNTTLTNLNVLLRTCPDAGCLSDVFLGLTHNATLQKVTLWNTDRCTVLKDSYSCATLQDLFLQNETLKHLVVNVRVPEYNDCALVVAQGMCTNTSLTSLKGVHLQPTEYVIQVMHHNCVLTELGSASAGTFAYFHGYTYMFEPQFDHFLSLNKLGRRHWVDPNFNTTLLLPHLLQRAKKPVLMYSILQTCLSYMTK